MVTEKQKANLIPQSKRAKSEQRKIARLGGIANGQARRMKSEAIRLLNLCTSKDEEREIRQLLNLTDKMPVTQWTAVLFALISKARKGDVKAIRVLAEITGDLDRQVQMDVTTGGSPLDIFAGLSARQMDNIIEQLAREE